MLQSVHIAAPVSGSSETSHTCVKLQSPVQCGVQVSRCPCGLASSPGSPRSAMATMQAGGVLPRTPCHAASYPHSQPPLNQEPFWQGWLHQIEMMDGGADSLKAAKNEFVTTRDIVYAYLENQCAMTMATKRGMESWAWAAALNGDGSSVGLCLVWATGNSSDDQETPLGTPYPWEGWWPCAVITTDSLIWVFYCPPMAWARQKAWYVHQSRLLIHDSLLNLRRRSRSHAVQLDEVSKEPVHQSRLLIHDSRLNLRSRSHAAQLDEVSKEPETEPETEKLPDQCMEAVGTWSPRNDVETRVCPGDGIEVEWKQPDAEGGFWAWGCVHPASGTPRSPRWGYFPLSCVPPPSPVDVGSGWRGMLQSGSNRATMLQSVST